MTALVERLDQAGKEILKAVDVAYAQASVLERQWDAHTAEQARQNLCALLKKLHTDDGFWSDLAKPVKRTLDPGTVDRLMRMDLRDFEEFEIRTFRAARVDAELARQWARDASSLLYVIRLGFADKLPEALRPDIPRIKACVELAHQELCEKKTRLTDPRKSALGKRRWKVFWGALEVVSGVGAATANGAVFLGTGGATAVLSAGTVWSGFWRALDGARRLQEIKGDRS